MTVTADNIQLICDEVTQQVAQSYAGLSLYFIIHGTGRMNESIALAEHDIISHRAGAAARSIVKKNAKGERSQFLGMAIAQESKMLGFKKIDHLLALFTINKDHFLDSEEARAHIYHLVWHAIDLYEIRQQPVYKNKFKSGPMVPKRSPLNLSKANLQADAFGAILMALRNPKKNDTEFVKALSKTRGIMSLIPVSNYKPEGFPSVIALESCEFMLQEIRKNMPEAQDILRIVRQASVDVGRAFDEENIKQWWDFSAPAQDMAWRGFTREEILGAAVNTSNNPYVRSIGYLIQEVTGLTPVSAAMLEHNYNAFVDPDINMQKHNELVDTIFEEAISEGGDEDTGRALRDAANKQNEDLTEGRILGWCANALQDAAHAVERALLSGTPATQAARMQFQGNRHLPTWDELKDLGSKIVDQRREGHAVTLGHIAEICHNHPAFAPVLGALKVTMNDPSYIQKLEAANDLAMVPKAPTMAPQTPAPKGPASQSPMPIAAPTLGGSNNGVYIARQNYINQQKQNDNSDESRTE